MLKKRLPYGKPCNTRAHRDRLRNDWLEFFGGAKKAGDLEEALGRVGALFAGAT